MRQAFTLMEVLIAAAVVLMVLGLGSVSLLGVQNRAGLAGAQLKLVADLRQQQLRAMLGDTQGGGVYLGTTSYTLFAGEVYVADDPANFEVELPASVTVTDVLVPGRTVLFSRGHGETVGYSGGADSWRLVESGGESKSFVINRWGTVDEEL